MAEGERSLSPKSQLAVPQPLGKADLPVYLPAVPGAKLCGQQLARLLLAWEMRAPRCKLRRAELHEIGPGG